MLGFQSKAYLIPNQSSFVVILIKFKYLCCTFTPLYCSPVLHAHSPSTFHVSQYKQHQDSMSYCCIFPCLKIVYKQAIKKELSRKSQNCCSWKSLVSWTFQNSLRNLWKNKSKTEAKAEFLLPVVSDSQLSSNLKTDGSTNEKWSPTSSQFNPTI